MYRRNFKKVIWPRPGIGPSFHLLAIHAHGCRMERKAVLRAGFLFAMAFRVILTLVVGFASSGLFVTTIGGGPAFAMNCDAIGEDVDQEKNLVLRHKLLRLAVDACPGDPQLLYRYAYSFERLRKYEVALRIYQEASRLGGPTDSKIYFGMADTYMNLGRYKPAIRAYQEGLVIEPDNKRAQKSLELARIKFKARSGGQVTSEEFVQVMQPPPPEVRANAPAAFEPLLQIHINFYTAARWLTDKAKMQLGTVGDAMQSEALKDVRFQIAGHTDDVGSQRMNLQLSARRAQTVRNFLIKTFDINPKRLETVHYGESRPAVPNTSAANRAINRRVEFKRLDSTYE